MKENKYILYREQSEDMNLSIGGRVKIKNKGGNRVQGDIH